MKIFLHGYLRDLHPEPLNVQASSVAEAISSLQLVPALALQPGQQRHSIAVDGFGSRDAIYDRTDVQEIHLRPVMTGAGKGGGLQIIIGIAIIALAVVTGGAGLFAGTSFAISQGSLVLAGAMMMLGGVMQMLAPQPTLGSMDQEEKSKFLGQAKNTVAIGTRIPIILGRHKWGGHFISFDIDAGDMNAAPESWYSSPFTSYADGSAPAATPMLDPAAMDSSPTVTINKVSKVALVNDFVTFTPSITLTAGAWTGYLSNGTTFPCTTVGGTITTVQTDGISALDNWVGQSVTFKKRYES